MSFEVKVPVLPESVADATVATWHKNPGDRVKRDENLVDLETDKVVLEVPAPRDGVLKSIVKPTGEVVVNDEVLAIIEEIAADAAAEPEPEPAAKAEPAAEPAPAAPAQAPPPAEAAESPPAPEASTAELSPAVHRLVAENKLDPSRIEGSGRDGRITKADVLKALEQPAGTEAEAAPTAAPAGARPEERVPMSRLRRRIAERMVEAQHSAAMLTSFNEVNLHAVMQVRKRYKESFEAQHGVRLGLMSFFVKASVDALKKFPVVNATVDQNDIIYHGYQDVGIAVATERGLVVPVLRDADKMSFAEIEQGIVGFANAARTGNLKLEDLQGGTFTITNGGVFGSLLSTPILNLPQSAILGMHTIKDRPVVEDGEIVARPMMYLALTYDHRIVDGADAVKFLVAIKDALEDPTRLLLNL